MNVIFPPSGQKRERDLILPTTRKYSRCFFWIHFQNQRLLIADPENLHLKAFSGLGNTVPQHGETRNAAHLITLKAPWTRGELPLGWINSEPWFWEFPPTIELSSPTMVTCLIMNALLPFIPSLTYVHDSSVSWDPLSHKLLELESLSQGLSMRPGTMSKHTVGTQQINN